MGSRTEVRARDDARALTAEPSDGGLAEGWVAVTGEVRTQSRTVATAVAVVSLVAAALIVALIDRLGEWAAVTALLPFVGVFAALALYSERPLRGAVTVGHRAVRVAREGREREIPIVCASSYSAYGESLVRLETAGGERVSIRCDEVEAERLLLASGVDALQSRSGALLGAGPWVRFTVATVAGCVAMLFVAMFVRSELGLALGALCGGFVGFSWWRPTRIEQGLDGIAKTGRRGWRYAWTRIETIKIEGSSVVVRTVNGATHAIEAATVVPSTIPSRSVDLELLLLMGRAERAFLLLKSTPKLPDELRPLARNGRPIEGWLDALRALCARDAPFRSVGVDREQLARALVHPLCEPDLRFACAWILCERWPDEWRSRVREVADACVVVSTRRALVAASEGASRATLLARIGELET